MNQPIISNRTSTSCIMLFIIYLLTGRTYGRVLSDNQLDGTLDMGNNISKDLDLVDIRNNKITSVTVYSTLNYTNLK
jgi:hypothetical protein